MHLAHNRFLPEPPLELKSCGDGDFRAIGAEFLGYFVHMADLRPDERILEIGCGVGRMAVPLDAVFVEDAESGRSIPEGIDVARQELNGASLDATPIYPELPFPASRPPSSALQLPREPFAAEHSCLPRCVIRFHMPCLGPHTPQFSGAHGLSRKSSRLLAPGGRCFATAFLVNPPAREALRQGKGRLAFDPDPTGPQFHSDPAVPFGCGRLQRVLLSKSSCDFSKSGNGPRF